MEPKDGEIVLFTYYWALKSKFERLSILTNKRFYFFGYQDLPIKVKLPDSLATVVL